VAISGDFAVATGTGGGVLAGPDAGWIIWSDSTSIRDNQPDDIMIWLLP
jgi:hypothetical protein